MLETILNLDSQLLLAINGAASSFGDCFMWNYTKTVVWVPLVLALLYVIVRNNKVRDCIVIIVCLALAFVIADQIASGFFKPTFQRLRPTHDPDLAQLLHVVNDYRGGLYGFVSSHAANSFAAVIFCSLVIRSWKFTVPLTVWAVINCWSRMYLGVHYPTDILCGAIVGAFAALAAYSIYVLVQMKLTRRPYLVTWRAESHRTYKNVNLINWVLLATVVIILLLAFAQVYL